MRLAGLRERERGGLFARIRPAAYSGHTFASSAFASAALRSNVDARSVEPVIVSRRIIRWRKSISRGCPAGTRSTSRPSRRATQIARDIVALDHVEDHVDAALAGERGRPRRRSPVSCSRSRGSAPIERQNATCRVSRRSRSLSRRTAFASWIAVNPMPLAPPCTSSHSPAASRPGSNTLFQIEVRFGESRRVAQVHPSGTGRHHASGATQYSAYGGLRRRARRRCRSPARFTALPRATTRPATSRPRIGLASGGGAYMPARCRQSGD